MSEAGPAGTRPADGARPADGVHGDDLVLPFAIEGQDLRGRLARLGPLVDTVLGRHDYPEPVSRILGEALTLVALVGSALKFQGIFTLQTKSDGPVRMIVADYRAPRDVRGYVALDAEAYAERAAAGRVGFRDLVGDGYLALTIDSGAGEPYQGIVALDGDDLSACAGAYFRDSEQIPTRLRLAVARETVRTGAGPVSRWRAGGLMLQYLPPAGPGAEGEERERGFNPTPEDGTAEAEAWQRALALIATVGDDELTDPHLAGDRLLYRLFHEDGVRAFDATPVAFGCRCGPERVRNVLAGFEAAELADMAVDGQIIATCEFCASKYVFAPDEFAKSGVSE